MQPKIVEALQPLAVPIDEIHCDPVNARTAHDLQGIADSLNKFGQRKPVVVNRNTMTIEAGNGTYQAAKILLGWSHIAAVKVDDDPLSATGYALADNRLTDKSTWHFETLDTLLEGFPDPLEIPGFDEDFLGGLDLGNGNGAGEPQEPLPLVDKAEELQARWQVKPGDIWAIGEHRLICGDCREAETWRRLLDGRKVNGVFTSPPYAEQRKKQYGGVPTAEYVGWWEAIQANVRANLAGDGSFFVNIKPHCEDGQRVLYVMDLVLAMVRRWGWRFVDECIWRHGGTPGKPATRFKNQFEPVYIFSIGNYKWRPANNMFVSDGAFLPAGRPNVSRNQGRGGSTLDGVETFEGMVYPGNVIETGKNQDAVGHSAAFPVALPTFFIRAYSDPSDLWLDPFVGSGTTMLAAHNEGRIGFGIERLEKYCSVVLERFRQHTGIDPQLVSG